MRQILIQILIIQTPKISIRRLAQNNDAIAVNQLTGCSYNNEWATALKLESLGKATHRAED